MRKVIALAASVLVFGITSPAVADVQVSMQNGHVTIVAKDATLRQILTEWARVGQTKIVNVERIPGGPLTIELRDVPEEQALRVLLRPISGYMTAPRTTATTNPASVFDRIIVMPTLAAASAPVAAAPPPPTPAPTFFPPPGVAQEESDDQQRANPGAQPQPASPFNRGPVFVFPQPVTTTPPAQGNGGQVVPQAPPSSAPPASAPPVMAPAAAFPGAPTTTVPSGVAVPGMVVPAPTPQPGGVAQPIPPQQ